MTLPIDIIKIRKILNLDKGIWKNMDDDLLSLAFIPKNGKKYFKNKEIIDKIRKKYSQENYELFEFFGDAVLEMLSTLIL